MKNLLALMLLIELGIGVVAYGGDNGGGSLSCLSNSGKTQLEGGAGVEYNGSGPANLVYRIEGHEIALNPGLLLDQGKTHLTDFVLFELGKSYYLAFKISTVQKSWAFDGNPADYITNSQSIFTMSSVLGTMKKVGYDRFKFVGKIHSYSIDPRKNAELTFRFDSFEKEIFVNCELDVSI